ncbi:hypothetical protein B296_00023518 [Ensete ventricosum]|uniref:Uncharacterized protein n=1 Tax=Ensete ventricosum TaxID=4639 RepID=A0A426Z8A1_ENSVE|nr:hypothetical protein B296_00023518 [Ensete ventricosum]
MLQALRIITSRYCFGVVFAPFMHQTVRQVDISCQSSGTGWRAQHDACTAGATVSPHRGYSTKGFNGIHEGHASPTNARCSHAFLLLFKPSSLSPGQSQEAEEKRIKIREMATESRAGIRKWATKACFRATPSTKQPTVSPPSSSTSRFLPIPVKLKLLLDADAAVHTGDDRVPTGARVHEGAPADHGQASMVRLCSCISTYLRYQIRFGRQK